jgi:hypothetical protein
MADKEYSRPTYASDFVKHDTKRAVYMGNVMIDNLVEAVVALGAEVWSNRRRQKVVEALLEEKGVTEEMIEAYMPSEEKQMAWKEDRDAFVQRTMSVLAKQADLPLSSDFTTPVQSTDERM